MIKKQNWPYFRSSSQVVDGLGVRRFIIKGRVGLGHDLPSSLPCEHESEHYLPSYYVRGRQSIYDSQNKTYHCGEHTAWLHGGVPVHVNTSVKDGRLYDAIIVNSDVIPDIRAI